MFQKKNNLFWFSLLLVSCGGNGSTTSQSCAPFDLSDKEQASYSFNDNGTIQNVTVNVDKINESSFTINYIENGKNNNSVLSTNCEVKTSGSFSRKLNHLLFDGFLLVPTVNSNNENVVAVWQESCDLTTEMLTVDAGNFEVRRCVLAPTNKNLNITSIIQYSKVMTSSSNTKPLTGMIKESINFNDGSSIVIKLTQWNNK